MPKETIEKTKLEDDALLYQKREEKKDREKFKELDGKGKLQFFRDYYLVKAVSYTHLTEKRSWRSHRLRNTALTRGIC